MNLLTLKFAVSKKRLKKRKGGKRKADLMEMVSSKLDLANFDDVDALGFRKGTFFIYQTFAHKSILLFFHQN